MSAHTTTTKRPGRTSAATRPAEPVYDKRHVAEQTKALCKLVADSGFLSIPYGLIQTVGLVPAAILAHIMFRHRPDDNGDPYFKDAVLSVSRSEFTAILPISRRSVTRALRLLEATGAIRCRLGEAIIRGRKLVNFIYIKLFPEVVVRLCFPDRCCQNCKRVLPKLQEGGDNLAIPSCQICNTMLPKLQEGVATLAALQEVEKNPGKKAKRKDNDDDEGGFRSQPTPGQAGADAPARPAGHPGPHGPGGPAAASAAKEDDHHHHQDSLRGSAASPPPGKGTSTSTRNAGQLDPADGSAVKAGRADQFIAFWQAEYQARLGSRTAPQIKPADLEVIRDHLAGTECSMLLYAVILARAYAIIDQATAWHCQNSKKPAYFFQRIQDVIDQTDSRSIIGLPDDKLWPHLTRASAQEREQLQAMFFPEEPEARPAPSAKAAPAKAPKAQAATEPSNQNQKAEAVVQEQEPASDGQLNRQSSRSRSAAVPTQPKPEADEPEPDIEAQLEQAKVKQSPMTPPPGSSRRRAAAPPPPPPPRKAQEPEQQSQVTAQQTRPSGRRAGTPPPPPTPQVFDDQPGQAEQVEAEPRCPRSDPQPKETKETREAPAVVGVGKTKLAEQNGNGQSKLPKKPVKQLMEVHDEDGDMVLRLVSEGYSLETVQDFFTRSSDLCGLLYPTYEDAKDWLARHPDYLPKKTNISAKREPRWRLPEPAKNITNNITTFNAAPEAERLKAIEKAEAKFRAVERTGKDSSEARADWLRLQHWQTSLSSAPTPTNSSHPGCSNGG